MPKPPLTVPQILQWADAHRLDHGRYPTAADGAVADTTWQGIDLALRRGTRGLPGRSSLAELLRQARGTRNPRALPPLRTADILRWADAHRQKRGRWPGLASGPIPGSGGETWSTVDAALRDGGRGHPGGSSLARLLEATGRAVNRMARRPLSDATILGWADAFHARFGRWPTGGDGPVPDAPDEDWGAVDAALAQGHRGLPAGRSLRRLLADRRGVHLPTQPHAVDRILGWADAFRGRAGRWPRPADGAVAEAPDESWAAIDVALQRGRRGLPGGDSLAQFLARHRAAPHPSVRPPLALAAVEGWARAHHARTGRWPTEDSGPVPEAAGETWNGVNKALSRGRRGLPGGETLAAMGRRLAAADAAERAGK